LHRPRARIISGLQARRGSEFDKIYESCLIEKFHHLKVSQLAQKSQDGDMPGYRVEYASSGRAKCNGRKPCHGTMIPKGQIRFGTWVTLHEHGSFKWRHWGCLTSPVLKNVSNELEGKIEELDGFEELQPADQDKIKKAFEDGKVDPADLPPTAVPEKIDDPVEEDGKKETKKRKRAPKKPKPSTDVDNTENQDEKHNQVEQVVDNNQEAEEETKVSKKKTKRKKSSA
ncbi:hypothetical protein MJO29_008384, partial [Puccinia striiformis f. sp. tritici]